MYTEDDDEVKEKSDDYNDFYTSFDQLDEKNNKKNSKNKKEDSSKKKSNKTKTSNIENDNDEDSYYIDDDKTEYKSDKKFSKKLLIVLTSLFAILLVVAIVILLITKKNDVKGDILITNDNISLKVGESDYISYKIVDTESIVKSTFASSDENVVVVDDNGKLTAIGSGEAVISINYTIDGKTREKKCSIKVTGDNSISKDVVLKITFSKGESDKWINKDAVMSIEANSVYGIDIVKYAINCNDNCDYKTINNNSQITVSNNGVTKIKIVATDKKKQKAEKDITIKIDKEAPNIVFDNKNVTSDKAIEVCATCSDNVSGCKQEKVCNKYTSSKSNQTLVVYDNAGNKKSSGKFNVTIKSSATKPVSTETSRPTNAPCTLKVSSDGIVTAKLNIAAEKYIFDDSTFSGKNELSKKISISAYKNGEEGDLDGASGAKIVHYYIKDKSGNIKQCSITVIKECNCPSSNTNCTTPVCTFKSN